MKLGDQIDELYELRSMRLDLENQTEELKRQEKILIDALIEQAQELGLQSLKGSTASFGIKPEVVPSVKAWEPIYDFILERQDFGILQKRLSVATWRDYYTEENIILPGTEAFQQIKASLRKL